MKNRRVILDTNLWISFLISKRQKELDELLESGAVTLIFSQELLEEFLEVSERQVSQSSYQGTAQLLSQAKRRPPEKTAHAMRQVWNQLNHRLLKWVKWDKGLYKMAAVRWLKHQYKTSPGLFEQWKLVLLRYFCTKRFINLSAYTKA